jgi:hypothetical protein
VSERAGRRMEGIGERRNVRATIINVAKDPELGARLGSSNVFNPKKLIVPSFYPCLSVLIAPCIFSLPRKNSSIRRQRARFVSIS